ncbi:KptA family-domain-containing protein [Podospora appendiculata]|uniref:2'-phosphotransferase n=1 Tax=Podospora appendiculata TaxID=314037 RepID=A0AAE0XHD9_9PEZI|nr:KptA family-domain-containing protein [Podospora appendiculata]
MAAAVASPLHPISNQFDDVLSPSDLAHSSPARHGRSRGMSVKGGKNGRGRGYSVIEERDTTIAKALLFVLKRTILEEDVDAEQSVENVVADAEGWVDLDDVLQHSRLSSLEADLEDVQRIASNASKSRFSLRQQPDTDAEDPASWEIRRITSSDSTTLAPVPVGEKLSADSADLPDFVVYETSYQRYPLILASGAITHARGGKEHLSFHPVTVDEEGTETHLVSTGADAADVSIWIHLPSALESDPSISWQRTENGIIVTSDEVPKSLWKKAVARRPDIGLLFEDGEVRKEVPAGLRGRGTKGKAKSGNKAALKRDGSEDDSGSASEE